jgi:hypothetical protein
MMFFSRSVRYTGPPPAVQANEAYLVQRAPRDRLSKPLPRKAGKHGFRAAGRGPQKEAIEGSLDLASLATSGAPTATAGSCSTPHHATLRTPVLPLVLRLRHRTPSLLTRFATVLHADMVLLPYSMLTRFATALCPYGIPVSALLSLLPSHGAAWLRRCFRHDRRRSHPSAPVGRGRPCW